MILQDDHRCYGCGKDNPKGLKLQFKRDPNGHLLSETVFSKEHQGYKDIVHGGMIATVLDEVMGNLTWLNGIACMTTQLTVRYKKAIRVGERVFLEGKIDSEEGRVIRASATAKNAQGETFSSASASYLKIKPR